MLSIHVTRAERFPVASHHTNAEVRPTSRLALRRAAWFICRHPKLAARQGWRLDHPGFDIYEQIGAGMEAKAKLLMSPYRKKPVVIHADQWFPGKGEPQSSTAVAGGENQSRRDVGTDPANGPAPLPGENAQPSQGMAGPVRSRLHPSKVEDAAV